MVIQNSGHLTHSTVPYKYTIMVYIVISWYTVQYHHCNIIPKYFFVRTLIIHQTYKIHQISLKTWLLYYIKAAVPVFFPIHATLNLRLNNQRKSILNPLTAFKSLCCLSVSLSSLALHCTVF